MIRRATYRSIRLHDEECYPTLTESATAIAGDAERGEVAKHVQRFGVDREGPILSSPATQRRKSYPSNSR